MASSSSKRVYGVQDIAKIFAVSTNAASDFLEEAIANQLFPVIKVGAQYDKRKCCKEYYAVHDTLYIG